MTLPKPRAWCVPVVGGDYLRSSPSLPNNGDPPMAWEPLYDSAAIAAAVAAERERCIGIIELHQVPVGNSAAGEMAAEWTMDALREVRDAIRAG